MSLDDFSGRAYLAGDAVKGIAEALRRDEDVHVVGLGCALSIVGEELSKLGLDLETADAEQVAS